MARINLLPWREELRKQRQKEFGAMAGVAALLMAGLIALAHVQVNALIENQQARNQFLEQEIAKLNKKIEEIKNLEREKENLLARMRIVEQLQTSRPEVVHLFDEFVTTMPDGAYLTSMVQKDRRITLEGLAQSNARVSSLMRNLDQSDWLTDPDLKRIQTVERKELNQRLSNFTLEVKQATPKSAEEETQE